MGKWEFMLGDSNGDASATCGHVTPGVFVVLGIAVVRPGAFGRAKWSLDDLVFFRSPHSLFCTADRIMTMVTNNIGPHNPGFPVARTLTVELANPNVVRGPDGRVGTWTTVYDEGIDVTLDGWNVSCYNAAVSHAASASSYLLDEFDALPQPLPCSVCAVFPLLLCLPCCACPYVRPVCPSAWLQYFTFFRYTPRTASARPTKVEDFHSHCNETISGWYHLSTAPKGKGSHSWGCFVGRQVARAVPLDSPEYSPELIKARGGMESGEMVLSADVMIAQQQARFKAAGSAGGRFADAALGDDVDAAAVRAPVSHAALAAAEAAEGGRASVEDTLAALLRGDGEGVQAAAAALGATSHRSALTAGVDVDAADADNAFITAFLETRAAASVSSDEAIAGLASADAAAEVVRRINAGADAGARLWRAEVPTHLLGLSREEARKRLGASASGKDVRAVSREAKAAARAAMHAAAGSNSGAAGSGHGHGHGGKHAAAHHAAAAHAHATTSSRSRARVNRRIAATEASNAALEHAHRMRLRARGSGSAAGAGDQRKHAVVDLSGKYGPHAAVSVDIASFPKSLDWSTAAGGAYIPDVLDQGHCGSCYAASATDALTARARIKAAGKLNGFSLSTQSVVQCSGHNQGCDGGYPYLVGKFGREIGFVPSECMHYTGRQDLCPARVDCPQAAKYASLWAGLAAPVTTNFLEMESGVAAAVEASGQGQSAAAGAAAAGLRGAAAGEDALVAALQMQVQAEHAQSAASADSAGAGAGAGPLGFAFHPHQKAAVAGERQLPQFRQHHEAEAGEGEALDEVAEQLAAGLMGADADADAESELAASLGVSGSGDNKGVGHGKTAGKGGLGVVQGSLANTYALSDERLRVSRYEYVGGFYGAGSESTMIAELQKGPLVVALNAPGDLFYYSGGIYHHDEKPEVRALPSTSDYSPFIQCIPCLLYFLALATNAFRPFFCLLLSPLLAPSPFVLSSVRLIPSHLPDFCRRTLT